MKTKFKPTHFEVLKKRSSPVSSHSNRDADIRQMTSEEDARGPARISSDLSRLLSAAVVNQEFCELLLRDPGSALKQGYNGETFSLDGEALDTLLSIRASSLEAFARELLKTKNGDGHPG